MQELADELVRLRTIVDRYMSGHRDFSPDEWPLLSVEISHLATGSVKVEFRALSAARMTFTGIGVAVSAIGASVKAVAASRIHSVAVLEALETQIERIEAERQRQLRDAAVAEAEKAEAQVRLLKARREIDRLENERRDSIAGAAGTTTTQITRADIDIRWHQVGMTVGTSTTSVSELGARHRPRKLLSDGADLSSQDLRELNFRDVSAPHALLRGAILDDSDLSRAQLPAARLTGASLRRALLVQTGLADAVLSHGDLTQARLIFADLTRADLASADLTSANLSDANLYGAALNHANLTGANLSRAKLISATLRNVNLTNANLAHADLTDADLTDADLTLVNLFRTNLSRTVVHPQQLVSADGLGTHPSHRMLGQLGGGSKPGEA